MVLLYEKSPNEVWDASVKERGRRMYKITGLSSMTINGCSYATINMRNHEEARLSKEVKAKMELTNREKNSVQQSLCFILNSML